MIASSLEKSPSPIISELFVEMLSIFEEEETWLYGTCWDNIIIFHEWTKNGLPNPAFKEKVGNFSGKNQIKYAFKAICRYLLTSLSEVKTIEDDASIRCLR